MCKQLQPQKNLQPVALKNNLLSSLTSLHHNLVLPRLPQHQHHVRVFADELLGEKIGLHFFIAPDRLAVDGDRGAKATFVLVAVAPHDRAGCVELALERGDALLGVARTDGI